MQSIYSYVIGVISHLVLLGESEVVISLQQLYVLSQLAHGDGRMAHHSCMTARATGSEVTQTSSDIIQITAGQHHSYGKRRDDNYTNITHRYGTRRGRKSILIHVRGQSEASRVCL